MPSDTGGAPFPSSVFDGGSEATGGAVSDGAEGGSDSSGSGSGSGGGGFSSGEVSSAETVGWTDADWASAQAGNNPHTEVVAPAGDETGDWDDGDSWFGSDANSVQDQGEQPAVANEEAGAHLEPPQGQLDSWFSGSDAELSQSHEGLGDGAPTIATAEPVQDGGEGTDSAPSSELDSWFGGEPPGEGAAVPDEASLPTLEISDQPSDDLASKTDQSEGEGDASSGGGSSGGPSVDALDSWYGDSLTGEPEVLETPKAEPLADVPVETTALDAPVEPAAPETSAAEPPVDAPVETTALDAPAEPAVPEAPAAEPPVDTPVETTALNAPAEPAVPEAPAAVPPVDTPVETTAFDAPAEPVVPETPAAEPPVDTLVETTALDAPAGPATQPPTAEPPPTEPTLPEALVGTPVFEAASAEPLNAEPTRPAELDGTPPVEAPAETPPIVATLTEPPPAEQAQPEGLSEALAAEIKALPKGDRPDPNLPNSYLSEEYKAWFQQQFKDGAVREQSDIMKWGIGRADGTFVTPNEVPTESLKSDTGQNAVKITMSHLENVGGVKIPSGNETAANNAWEPGGKLPDGTPEGVVDIDGRPVNRLIRNTLS